jgi:hypothetical protein
MNYVPIEYSGSYDHCLISIALWQVDFYIIMTSCKCLCKLDNIKSVFIYFIVLSHECIKIEHNFQLLASYYIDKILYIFLELVGNIELVLSLLSQFNFRFIVKHHIA